METSAPTAGGRSRRHDLIRLLTLIAALLAAWSAAAITSTPARAATYDAEMQSGWTWPSAASNIEDDGNGMFETSTAGANGTPDTNESWSAPTGESFAGVGYTAANFYATATLSPYTGAFSGGIWAYSPSVSGSIVLPWTDDCSVYLTSSGKMYWTSDANPGVAENGATGTTTGCTSTGNESGWNYTNIQEAYNGGASTAGDEWSSIELHVGCDAAKCPTADGGYNIAQDEVDNFSAVVDDPDSAPVASESWSGANSSGWYTTAENAPTLELPVSDPSGICYLDASLSDDAASSGDLVTSPTTGNGGLVDPGSPIGEEFSSDHPCADSGTYTWTLPSGTYSGTYTASVSAANAAQYEGASFSSSGASTVASGLSINIDDVTPVVEITAPTGTSQTATATVTVGPSGLSAAPVCTVDGNVQTVSLVSGSTSGAGTTTWNVADPDQLGVSCVATNNDVNATVTNTGVGYSDSANTQGDFNAASQTTAVSADTFMNAAESISECRLGDSAGDYIILPSSPTSGSGEGDASFDAGSLGVNSTDNGQWTSNCSAADASEATYGLWIDSQDPELTYDGAAAEAAATGDWVSGEPVISGSGSEVNPQDSADSALLSGVTAVSCTVNGETVSSSTTTPRPPGWDLAQPSAANDYQTQFILDDGNGSKEISCTPTTGAGEQNGAFMETVKVDDVSSETQGTDPYGASPDINDAGAVYSPAPTGTWSQTAQTVDIVADHTGGGSPIVSVTCTGGLFSHGASSITTNGTADSDNGIHATVTVDASDGEVSCVANDSAGQSLALGTWGQKVDTQAPTGSFVARSAWPTPDGIEIDATDPNGVLASTVRTVDVKARDMSTGVVADLGYATAEGGDLYELTDSPDGQLPAGRYRLTAVATDAAGNAGTIIGPTLQFPLRTTTKLTVTIGTGKHKKSASQQAATPKAIAAANMVESHTTIPASFADGRVTESAKSAASIEAAAAKIVKATIAKAKKKTRPLTPTIELSYGQKLTLVGKLTEKRKAVKDAVIRIYAKASGSSTISLLHTVHTGRKGKWSYRVRAGVSRILYVTYPGNATLRSATDELRQTFSGKVTISTSGAFVADHEATLTGRVQGGHIPVGGVHLQIWYTVAGSRSPFVHWMDVTSKRNGRWRYSFRLGDYTAGLTYEFEARVRGQFGWPYREAVSRPAVKAIG